VINCDKISFLEKYVMQIFFITYNNFYFFVKTKRKMKNRKNSENFAKTFARKFFIFRIFLQVIFAKMQKRKFSFQHYVRILPASYFTGANEALQGGISSYRKRGGENQNCLQVKKKSTGSCRMNFPFKGTVS
jgi:hypothetical protein